MSIIHIVYWLSNSVQHVPKVVLSCPIPDCGSRFDNVDVVGAAAILNVLAHTHTNLHLVPAHDTPSV